jgi:cytochrome c6
VKIAVPQRVGTFRSPERAVAKPPAASVGVAMHSRRTRKGAPMKRLLFALAVLSLAGNTLAADAATLFGSKCSACHGKDGKGTAVGKKMGAPDLAGATKDSDAEIVGVISNGKGKMAAYKDKLSADEIQALAKYVKAGLK